MDQRTFDNLDSIAEDSDDHGHCDPYDLLRSLFHEALHDVKIAWFAAMHSTVYEKYYKFDQLIGDKFVVNRMKR